MALCRTKNPPEDPNGGDDDREDPQKMHGEPGANQNERKKQNQ
jgi:hypothetical protein